MRLSAMAPAALLHYEALPSGRPAELGHTLHPRVDSGTVLAYVDTKTGEAVAIKRIQIKGRPAGQCAVLAACLAKKLLLQHGLNHPHVIKLKDVFLDQTHLNLVMELASGGSMLRHVNQAFTAEGYLSEGTARWYFQQLVLALDYLHAKGEADVHIRIENTMLKLVPRSALRLVKVSAVNIERFDAIELMGESPYDTPESWKPGAGAPIGPAAAAAADVWRVGVALAGMLLGRHLFSTNQGMASFLQQLQARPLLLPDHLSLEVKDLLEALLQLDPANRMTVQGIKQHPWFLQGLPPGALDMTAAAVNAPSPCAKSLQELRDILTAVEQQQLPECDAASSTE